MKDKYFHIDTQQDGWMRVESKSKADNSFFMVPPQHKFLLVQSLKEYKRHYGRIGLEALFMSAHRAHHALQNLKQKNHEQTDKGND